MWCFDLSTTDVLVMHGFLFPTSFQSKKKKKILTICTPEFQITTYACLFILIFIAGLLTLYLGLLNQICFWCQPTPLLGPVCLTPRE